MSLIESGSPDSCRAMKKTCHPFLLRSVNIFCRQSRLAIQLVPHTCPKTSTLILLPAAWVALHSGRCSRESWHLVLHTGQLHRTHLHSPADMVSVRKGHCQDFNINKTIIIKFRVWVMTFIFDDEWLLKRGQMTIFRTDFRFSKKKKTKKTAKTR